MARSSLVHYIAPSAIGITPNCNESENDLDVYLARGAKIKVYSPNAGIGTEDTSFQEWSIKGRNRRLADSSKPYTIYARLSKTDKTDGYLVFAPKAQRGGGWVDKYPYVTPQGIAYPEGYADPGNYWYVRMGTVTLPENHLRSITFDTGILGTDQFNTEWNMNPDQLNRILLECTIDGVDAGPTPYVYWDKSLVMKATLNEGWDDEETGPFDHWEIVRNSGDTVPDAAWALGQKAQAFASTGQITLDHIKGGTDDFNATVAPTFKVVAWGKDAGGTFSVIATVSISILAETVEKYDLQLSTSIVSYNPQTKTYSPEGGVSVRIRATDQKGETYRITREQYGVSRLGLAWAYSETDQWTPLTLDPEGVSDVAVATIPVSVFAAQRAVEVHLTDAAGKELSVGNIAFVRDGEDSREREWIFLRSPQAITFGDAQSEHPKPSLITMGEVSPQGVAQGITPYDNTTDDWVPEGWTDDAMGTDEVNLYEYGSYRDYVHSDPSDPESEGHWGDFTTPRVWSHYGEDAVTYDLIPSVSVINATNDGYITSDGIIIRAYRTEGKLRSGNILPDDDYPVVGDYYYAEYSIDGKAWTECSKFSYSKGDGYGISAAVVATVTESVVFRLKHTEEPDVVLKESLPINVVKSMSDEEASERYLSKLHDDEAHGLIGFLKGLWVGIKGKWGWSADGNITANDIVTEGNVTVGKILKAFNAYINKVQSTNYTGDGLLDTGWRITNDYQGGNSAATFDYLTIRKKAFFNELEIRKLSSIGGNFCLSPASGRIFQIKWFDGDGNLLGYDQYNIPWTVGGRLLGLFSKSLAQKFLGKRKRLARQLKPEELTAMRTIRCYFYTDDGTTQTMLNWTVGAQARCQTFNIEDQMEHVSGGESHNDDVGFYDSDYRGESYRTETDMYGGTEYYRGHKVSNTYWWRLVTAVGKERLDDGKLHYYIEFMVNTGSDRVHADYGSDLPSVGDQVVQMGHRTREDQQNVIIFYTADEAAPAIKMYSGINSWDLNGRLVAQMSPKGWKVMASSFEWMTAYGLNTPTIIRGLWVGIPLDANGQRRCYYNDVVSHNGSWWRCIVNPGKHKEDAAMTHWYTQEEIDQMSLEEQMALIDVDNYTVLEPGDATFEQRAVWQVEVSQQIAPYLIINPALFSVACEKDVRATAAYSVSASVKLMVTNLEAAITSITMTGADSHVRLSGNYVTVNFAAGDAVTNKDYMVTVEGTLNGQKYTATDKVSVYAVVRGNDAYEVTARPTNWLWNQEGANYSYEDIMRIIEEGISPSDFPIEIDKVETLPDGRMGNSCAQLSVVNGGVAQPFQIVSVVTSDNRVTTSYNNVTGRVWVTAVPNTLESGWVDVTVRYGNNVTSTLRIPFWCNLLGTWREIVLGDTHAAIAEKTVYYVGELNKAKKELSDIIDANESARDQTDQIMKDGLITDEEKGQLKAIKKTLQSEYDEATGAYTPVYGNAGLTAAQKQALATAKSTMDAAYNAVIGKIDELLALTTISKNGADAVNTTFNNFKSALQAYRTALETATNQIISNGDSALNTMYTDFHAEYVQSSEAATQKFTKITGILGENGEKVVTQTEFGEYKQSADQNLAALSRTVDGKVDTSTYNQTISNINLSLTTTIPNSINDAKNQAISTSGDNADAKIAANNTYIKTQTGIDITNGNIELRADKVHFTSSDGTKKDLVAIDPTTGGIVAKEGNIGGFEIDNQTNLHANNASMIISGKGSNENLTFAAYGPSKVNSLFVKVSSVNSFPSDVTQWPSFVYGIRGTFTLPQVDQEGFVLFIKPGLGDRVTVQAPSGYCIQSEESGSYFDSRDIGDRSMIFIYTGYKNSSTNKKIWTLFYCG